MKKLFVLAMASALGIAGSSAVPVAAAETKLLETQWGGKNVIILGGQVSDPSELNDKLEELCSRFGSINIDLSSCPIITLPCPDLPEIDVPGTDAPETDKPEVDIPEIDAPVVDTPSTDVPGTDNDQTESRPEQLSFAEQVVKLVNEERAKAGLNEVVLDKELEAAAFIRAKETEISFSHTRPDGRSFVSVLNDQGISYRGAGENIAWGQSSPEEVMRGWMNSDGHRANILNPNFTTIGVGYYQNANGRNYWTQLFTY